MESLLPPISSEARLIPRKPIPKAITRKPVPNRNSGIVYERIGSDQINAASEWSEALKPKIEDIVEHEELNTAEYASEAADDWKPWSLRWWFLTFLFMLHVLLALLIQLTINGWFERRRPYISVPTSIPGDDSTKFSLIVFGPIACALAVGALWEIVDLQVRRLAPYYAMARKEGASVEEAVNADYVSAFIWILPIQAGVAKQWLIMTSSLAFLSASIAIPAVVSAGWYMEWNVRNNTFDSVLWHTMLEIATALNAIQALLTVALFFLLRTRRSGLKRDPASFAGLASMICESPELLSYLRVQRSYDKREELQKSLAQVRFFLRQRLDSQSLQIIAKAPTGAKITTCETTFQQSRSEAHPIWLWGRTWLAIDIVTAIPHVVVQIYISSYTLSYGNSGSIDPAVAKICYTISVMVGTTFWQIVQREIAMLQPLYAMSNPEKYKRDGTLPIGWEYVSHSSLSVMRLAGTSGGGMLLLVTIESFIQQASTVFFPPLWSMISTDILPKLADSYISVDDFPQAIMNSLQPIKICSIIIAIYAVLVWIGCLCSVRKAFLPRQPNTLLSQMVYICGSDKLLESMKGTSMLSKKDLQKHIDRLKTRCEFQWFEDARGVWRVGIEEGPAQQKYKFGQKAPPVDEP